MWVRQQPGLALRCDAVCAMEPALSTRRTEWRPCGRLGRTDRWLDGQTDRQTDGGDTGRTCACDANRSKETEVARVGHTDGQTDRQTDGVMHHRSKETEVARVRSQLQSGKAGGSEGGSGGASALVTSSTVAWDTPEDLDRLVADWLAKVRILRAR
jgi:hypothetical protein